MRRRIFACAFFCQSCKKNFCLPSCRTRGLDKIFWIYHVWVQAPNFGLEKFTPTVTSTQCNFSLWVFRDYVNLAILNSEIDKRCFSISHLVREKSLRPLLPHLEKIGQNLKFQNGLWNEQTGKIFQQIKFLPRKPRPNRNGSEKICPPIRSKSVLG